MAQQKKCRCGCGKPVKPGSRYITGHDQRHLMALLKEKFRTIERAIEWLETHDAHPSDG